MATRKKPASAKITKNLPPKKPVQGGYVIDWRHTQDSSVVSGGGSKGIIIDY